MLTRKIKQYKSLLRFHSIKSHKFVQHLILSLKKLRRTKKFDYKKAKNKKKALKNSNKADIHQQATKDKNVLTNGVFFKKKNQ